MTSIIIPPESIDWRSLYRDATDLETRVVLLRTRHQFLTPSLSELERIVALGEDEHALDLGCGIGVNLLPIGPALAEAPDLIGMDLSFSVLATAQRHVSRLGWRPRLLNTTAERLPFEDAEFDVVLARHMLYHVQDIGAALKEVRRILRPPGGRLIATTNSRSSRPELTACHERAAREVGGLQLISRGSARFGSENGKDVLAEVFASVTEIGWRGRIVFEEASEALGYYLSTPYFQKSSPDPEQRRLLQEAVRAEVEAEIQRKGAFTVSTWGSIYVARSAREAE